MNLDEHKRQRYGLVLHRVIESFRGLEMRTKELMEAEKRIVEYDPEQKKEKMTLDELQNIYVNKTEAYHQQIYSTISNLIMVANYFGINGKKVNHPIRSVEKFLKFIMSDILPTDAVQESDIANAI